MSKLLLFHSTLLYSSNFVLLLVLEFSIMISKMFSDSLVVDAWFKTTWSLAVC